MYNEQIIRHALRIAVAVALICMVHRWLELCFYGEVQPRLVDDVMLFVYLPFISRAVWPKIKS